jgi:hypothetical protein
MKVIKLQTNDEADEGDQTAFFDTLREQTDQLIYVSKDNDGGYNFGHTPLSSGDLALMQWHLNKVMDLLIQSAGNDED